MKKGSLISALALVAGLVVTNAIAQSSYTGTFSACTKDGKQVKTKLTAYPAVDFGANGDAVIGSILQEFWNNYIGHHTAKQVLEIDMDIRALLRGVHRAEMLLGREPSEPTALGTWGVSIAWPTLTNESCSPRAP